MSQIPTEQAPVEYRDVHELIMARLAAPFPNVKRRDVGGGRQEEYIDPYMAMNRLDDVLGPSNWEDRYLVVDTCVICTVTIKFPDGEIISRSDSSAFDVRTDKGWTNSKVKKTAFSDAFKRACKKFGIGRYLMTKGKQPNYYRRIASQARAVPDPPHPTEGTGKTSEPPGPEEFPSHPRNPERPGVALFRLATSPEGKRVRMLDSVMEYGEENACPQKVVDWSYQQVQEFCAHAGIPIPFEETT
jgi:hypothetical protein